MPGFTIHLAVGKEYCKKHPNQIQDNNAFFNGIIAPDFDFHTKTIITDKSASHYGSWVSYHPIVFFDTFFTADEVHLEEDFWKGYFLHLLTDQIFYQSFFKEELALSEKTKEKFYPDYDVLNPSIIQSYDLTPPEIILPFFKPSCNKLRFLTLEKVQKFIDFVSSFDLTSEDLKEKLRKGGNL